MFFRALEARLDQIDLMLRCRNAFLRLLLKGMQHIDDAGKPDRIDCAIGIAVEVVDDLKNAAPPNPLSALAVGLSAPICASSID